MMINILKKYPVLWISLLCALISMVFVPPDSAYAGYVDLRVLCLLFCLMAAIQGFTSIGLFRRLAGLLLKRIRSLRGLYLVLVFLPFFFSMVVTNDVALLTFVPFALYLLRLTDSGAYKIPILVLQTIAANVGSMLTPLGNPQNLYLYTAYGLDFGFFLSVTFLPVLLTGLLLILGIFLLPRREIRMEVEAPMQLKAKPLILYGLLFALCLLTVLHLLPYPLTLVITVVLLLCVNPALMLRVDYSLLLTFVCFFIFSGNLSRLPALSLWLEPLLTQWPVAAPAMVSQVISNVPAALLLSPFTGNARGLLLGVNIGGLGTLIASLASVITFQLYCREPDARVGAFLGWFSLLNFLLLAVLLLIFH